MGRGHIKWTMASASTSIWEKCWPPADSHLEAEQFSSSLYVSGVFQAAAPALELRGSESESMHGPFKRDSRSFHLPQTEFLLFFTARSYGDISPWCGVRTPCSSAAISLLIFIHHSWVWDQPVLHLHPFYQSWCGFFFNSVVTGLPFSSLLVVLSDSCSVV